MATPVGVGAVSSLMRPDKVFAIGAFIVLSSAFLPLLFGYGDPGEASRDPVQIQLVRLAFYVGAGALLIRVPALRSLEVTGTALLILMLAFAATSFTWSIDPTLTLKRLVPLMGATLVGIYFAARFTLEGFLRVVFVATFAMTAVSLMVGLLLPQYGVSPGSPLWAGLRGVFSNKNTLGPIAGLAALVSIYYAATAPAHSPHMWMGIVGLGQALLCLAMTLSATSYIVTAATLAAIPVLRLIQRSGSLVAPMLASLLLVAAGALAAFMSFSPELLSLLGRDPTLTGRTDIWTFATYLISGRPWLGYGYGVAWEKLGWYFKVVHAHNGFLQVTLDLGLVGLAICLFLLLQVAFRCWLLFMQSSSLLSTFPATLFLLVLLGNIAEVNLLAGHTIQCSLLVYVAVQTALDLRAQRTELSFRQEFSIRRERHGP